MSVATHAIVYDVAPHGESLNDIGVVYRVIADHGRCGCGAVEMKSTIAYFPSREDAVEYAGFMNQQEARNGR